VQAVWWVFDTKGPYDRLFGRILPAQEGGRVIPGADVLVEWEIALYRQDCNPVNSLHVSRTITDVNGVHELPKTENVYGLGKRQISNPLRRPFVLPDYIAPGPAVYHSEAAFVCNPLWWALNMPNLITTPDVYFTVEMP
jgi:hypothetical protein